MNHAVTSKETLLQTAKEIVYSEGLNQLNIRRVAFSCGISIGAVYNYFPSKEALIFALVEDFWSNIAGESQYSFSTQMGFSDYFEQIYSHLALRLKDFKLEFLQQISQFSHAEKEKGKAIEKIYWQHMKDTLMKVLEQDKEVSSLVFNDSFTKDAFIEFIFTNMITSLKNGEKSSVFLKEIITRLLY